MSLTKMINKLFQRYWRFSRGLTMGAQAAIVDAEQRVLLVRHGYRPGWHFPGGGVEYKETVRQALAREILEEAGVVLQGEPMLHGVFSNKELFPGDHVVLFVVREWTQDEEPKLGLEIAEWGFFALDDLPEGVVGAVRRRLAEIFDSRDVDEHW